LIVWVAHSAGEGLGDPDVSIALPGGRQPGVAGKLARRWLYDEWLADKG